MTNAGTKHAVSKQNNKAQNNLALSCPRQTNTKETSNNKKRYNIIATTTVYTSVLTQYS